MAVTREIQVKSGNQTIQHFAATAVDKKTLTQEVSKYLLNKGYDATKVTITQK